ncbi:hypothetical protein ELG83_06215 [Rhizobium leguminosarum]|uniref:Uncharacterized protein n=1 Tax=Rhizobium leguminosarum bv. viciae TaxID=387 RepID=A0A8G2IXQ9_RHILV|nr:hypothetical protein [Rhizobium leguminosarum bv. viciae]TBF34838.1 hypothetical protein ELG88_06230 [Rhizobium leguminosarum]NKK21493.1 hypothetical protein [Rhizobium leguminosarum bv. viciae]NKK50179.1 hypothetical protein [Rhizobium leguminosarum bv. viciae]NKL18640.1 hypothetical protein [Rhizobium leguminosarum bv. viciae]
MQITVFMAGFMARFALPVKGAKSDPAASGSIHPMNRLQQPTSLKPVGTPLKFVRHFRGANLA